jgi:hypothetical protein
LETEPRFSVFYPDETEQGTVADPTTGDTDLMPADPEAMVEPADQAEPGHLFMQFHPLEVMVMRRHTLRCSRTMDQMEAI